jgi:hypothetical protein
MTTTVRIHNADAGMSDLDLITALAQALRTAQQEGNAARSRVLLSTLQQELHVLGLGDPAGDTCPALIRSNGRLQPEWLEEIGVEVEAS